MTIDGYGRPPGLDDDTLAALGKLSEAVEWAERARGRLYDFHHLIGRADFLFEEAADRLEAIGAVEQARRVREEVVGRNVIPRHWTFQLVDEFYDSYHDVVAEAERDVRRHFGARRRHLYEAELKERRRTDGRHERHTAEVS